MTVSIIIVNFNGLHYTRQCIESFYKYHSSHEYEIIVVDNNSSDGSQTELPTIFPLIKFIPLPENKGFGVANNVGAEQANGKYLFFVNNDTLFTGETIVKLYGILSSKSNYGMVGPKLLNKDMSFQLSFGDFPSLCNEFYVRHDSLKLRQEVISDQPMEKNWITGAAIMIKKELFETIGGFDEQYFMYFEDVDLCRTVYEKGYQSLYVPFINMVHFGGKSYAKENSKIVYEYRRSQLRYYDKHNSFFQRIMIRIYIFLKFLPRLFPEVDHRNSKNVIKLIFSNYK